MRLGDPETLTGHRLKADRIWWDFEGNTILVRDGRQDRGGY